MKKLLLLFICGLAYASPEGNINGHVKLTWDYPADEIGQVEQFYVYTSTDIALPVQQWTLATNVSPSTLSVSLDIQPSHYFFVVTASNFWGETSIYSSNVASVPFPAVAMNGSLKIQKLP
jgi:hypothetical protein